MLPALYLLQSCRNGDDFLDGAAQSLDVVVPVQDLGREAELGQ